MALPLYLAMTAAEMSEAAPLPPHFAYMACHFSPYGTGLSCCPKQLPEGSLLILNDRTPICGHDPHRIEAQLKEILDAHQCRGLLLDFQRPGYAEAQALATHLCEVLPCPVGVSLAYGEGLDSPLFLPPAYPDTPLEAYLKPWQGREIWLEAALDCMEIVLTESGAAVTSLPHFDAADAVHRDEKLHCHYYLNIEESRARFTLYRTREDVEGLLEEAESLGVTLAVGLWQELNCRESSCRDARLPNSEGHDTIDPSNMFES